MNPIELRFSGRVELAALRFNSGAPHRVVALHGWLDNAMSFAPLATAMPDCEITALEFAGHGRSGHLPDGCWYHFIDYLDDVEAAFAELAAPDLLLGHSLGGAVATAFAAARPQRIPRLALIEALGPLAGNPDTAVTALRQGLDERKAIGGKSLRVFASVEQAVMARLGANRMERASAELLVERALRPAGDGFVWASDPRLTVLSPWRIPESFIRNWITAIESPTLLIAADNAPPYFQPEVRESRLGLLRDPQLQVLPGHHHLHMDGAAAVAEAVRAFLGGTTGSAP